MRFSVQIALCFALAAGSAMAQRGGGGGGARGGGGFGGGMRSGGGSVGGGGGGFRGGGGFVGGGFNRGFVGNRFFVGNRGFFGGGFWPGWGGGWWGWPGWGLGWGGLGWGLGYADSYDNPYGYYPNYGNGYAGGYAGYQTSPNVTVVYPPAPPQPVTPVIREYDQFGQEIRPGGGGSPANTSPIYLIAFNDHTIRAAASYYVEGRTLHYVTLDRQELTAPLDTVDRNLSQALNRERQVPFSLPQ
jgi:hypothetical protein